MHTQPDIASFTDFARLLGKRPSWVTQLRKDGRLVLTEDGKRVMVAESIARIEDTRDPAMQAVADRHAAARVEAYEAEPEAHQAPPPADGDEPDEDGNMNYQSARALKEHYLAMAAKRDYEIAVGKLLAADEVRMAIASAAATLRADLENLPDNIAPVLAAETDEARIRVLLTDEIEHMLENLSERFRQVAQQARDGGAA